MPGQQKDTFTALTGGLKVFKAVMNGNILYVFFRILGKQAKLGKLAAHAGEYSAKNPLALAAVLLRECQLEIAQADAAQFRMREINQLSQRYTYRTGERTRKKSYPAHQGPERQKFQFVAH